MTLTYAPRPGAARRRTWHRLSLHDVATRRAFAVVYLRANGPCPARRLSETIGWSDVETRLLLTELLADGCVERSGQGHRSSPYLWRATC